MTVPRILFSTWRRQGRVFGPVLRDMYGVEVQFVHAVRRAGALSYLVPLGDGDPAESVDGFDGLVLIGGEDLTAQVSGVAPEDVGGNASVERDRWELGLLDAALERDLPVLAICRGMQVLNVALGGTLLGEIAGISPDHPPVPDDLDAALAFRHDVELEAGSFVARVYGTKHRSVNSLHHQALDRIGDGLRVTGRAPDGIVEAVELPSARWCLGVQWHPELLPADDPYETAMLRDFVDACAKTLVGR